MTHSGPLPALASIPVTEYPRDRCVHELLEEQARRSPDAVAAEFESESLTQRQLHARADRLASILRDKGVGPDVLVGICLERSLEMPVALLGVLKAGGAYVPLDPSHGEGRIQYVLEEARVQVLIAQERVLSSLGPVTADVICLERGWGGEEQGSPEPLPNIAGPRNLAYVIYTSGSTGKPKGVQLEHRGVVNFLCSMQREPGFGSADVLIAVTTLSFDIAGLEMFLPPMSGGRLVIANRETTYDGARLARLMSGAKATVLQATPATWRLLFESGWQGDPKLKVLIGGEAVSPQLAGRLAACCGEVWNMYGPTETTIWSSVYRIRGDETQTIPIGKPIANTALYILQGSEPAPEGTEGELCIGGEGLARGYFQKPELTAQKFVADPFRAEPGARMYRTGDLAKMLPSGDLAFLGRLDHQVKIRGFRIELGEVEAVLEQHPDIHHAVAMARDDESGDSYLAAWYIPAPGRSPSLPDLRSHLRRQLPEYMVPSAFIRMTELPLTHNGKVDRKRLPEPSVADREIEQQEYTAPRTEAEKKLALLWQDALGLKRIGITDNFFDLGGRSLTAARMFVKMAREFGKELPISTLFQAPTIELLARQFESGGERTGSQIVVPIRTTGSKPPFFCVHGGGGSTLFLQHLAERVSRAGRPFYGIEPDILDGSETRHETVEKMAAFYLAEIRKVQPRGPYHLGGYCFGALVAYEMARQLERQGEKAAAVVLFTGPLRFNRPPAAAGQVSQSMSRLARLKASPTKFAHLYWTIFYKTLRRKRTRAIRAAAWVVYRSFFRAGRKIPAALRPEYIRRTLIRAELGYRPEPYSGRLILFYGSKLTRFGRDLGWGGLAGSLEHHVVGDCDYETRREQFDEPVVDRTAEVLNACLDRI